MRFTGQVKIPDLDYPGVPASVQVDGNQVELFVEGESLGRWSLVDVRAERLVSSAFSMKLAGEEVTFIADQPTEFAYGGVEAMATVWAKHKSMRLPMRFVANSKSRQGTKPSRIQDLREAIEETLAGNTPMARDSVRPPAPRAVSGIASLRDATGRPPAQSEPQESAETPSPVEERQPEPEPVTRQAAVEPSTGAAGSGSDAPGPRDPVPVSPDTPDAVFAEPDGEEETAPPSTDSVFKQSVPWAKSEESESDDAPEAVAPIPPAADPAPRDPAVAESAMPDEPDQVDDPDEPEEAPAPAQSGSVPWLAPPAAEEPATTPVSASEPPPEDAREVDPVLEPENVVDIDAVDEIDRRDGERGDEVMVAPVVEADDVDEDASPQMASTAARGGIMGAVRSAFARNRVEHTHEYVEAPGGLGIKRQICAACGHISIGVE